MKAFIKTNTGLAEIRLPCSRMQLAGALAYVGLAHKTPYEITANGISNCGCEVKLSPDNELDYKLLLSVCFQVQIKNTL